MKTATTFCYLFSISLLLCLSSCADKSIPSKSVETNVEKLLLDRVQRETFGYFWDGAEPISGLAPERIHIDGYYSQNDSDVIACGGSGFGIMAMLVAIERGFVSRKDVVVRLEKAVTFLETAERFHGAWPHWMYPNGKPKPFSRKDDAGDIVETSYLAQGLLCARQYFKKGNTREKVLAARLDKLWREIEWDWYRGPNQENVLYWHWSPNFGWEMNHQIEGYNECLITYVLAASSPTHTVPAEVYHEGWSRNGGMVGNTTKYGRTLVLKHNGSPEYGGPLFWSHYSFLGLDPRKLKDRYADYWTHNVNHVIIDYEYCVENPNGYKGYSPECWGLTSSYSVKFYAGHRPEEDLGVITPTAALSSFPYSQKESMAALKHFYHDLGDKVVGKYGPYDAFSIHYDWYPVQYLAIDQGPIPVMIENYRSGLLWELFMSSEEVQAGLTKLGFTY